MNRPIQKSPKLQRPKDSISKLRALADAPTTREPVRRAPLGILLCLAFLVLFEYALARPPVEAIFLRDMGSEALPVVWLVGALVSAFTAWAFSAMTRRVALNRCFAWINFGSLFTFLIIVAISMRFQAQATFGIYLWKDLHIVLLVESFWAYVALCYASDQSVSKDSQSHTPMHYGWFCAAGSIGGVSGNLLSGQLAYVVGTSSAVFAVVPCTLIIAIFIFFLPPQRSRTQHSSKLDKAAHEERTKSLGNQSPALKSIEKRQRKYIYGIFALIIVVQLTIALIDFRFNLEIEHRVADLDARTGWFSKIYAVIDATALVFQAGAGWVIRTIGIMPTLKAIPLTSLCAVVGLWFFPSAVVGAGTKILSKSLDYSLFRVAKELLYRPLDDRTKVRAKAWADVFGYRASKAGASLLLMAIVATTAGQVRVMTAMIAIVGTLVAWLGVLQWIQKWGRNESVTSPNSASSKVPSSNSTVQKPAP